MATLGYAFTATPFGELLVAGGGAGLVWADFVDGTRAAALDRLRARRGPDLRPDPALAAALDGWPERAPPVVPAGTAFQRAVWDAVQAVEAGTTSSYAVLAARLGRPRAARAVARALAGNEIALAVPCHRVCRRDGPPGGYRWGPDRKRAILQWEHARIRP